MSVKKIFSLIFLFMAVPFLGMNLEALAAEDYGVIYAEDIVLEGSKGSFEVVVDIIDGEKVGAIGMHGIRYNKDQVIIDSIEILEEKMLNWDNPSKETILNEFGLASIEYGRSAIAEDPQEPVSGKIEVLKINFTVLDASSFPIKFDLSYDDKLFFMKDGGGQLLDSTYNFFREVIINEEGTWENNIQENEIKSKEELVEIAIENGEIEVPVVEEEMKLTPPPVNKKGSSGRTYSSRIKTKVPEVGEEVRKEEEKEEIKKEIKKEEVLIVENKEEQAENANNNNSTPNIKSSWSVSKESLNRFIRSEGNFVKIKTKFENRENKDIEYSLESEDLCGLEINEKGVIEWSLPIVSSDKEIALKTIVKEKDGEIIHEEEIKVVVLNQTITVSGVLKTLGSNELIDGKKDNVKVYSVMEDKLVEVNEKGEFSIEINPVLTDRLEIIADSYKNKVIRLPEGIDENYVITDDDQEGDVIFNDINKLRLIWDVATSGEDSFSGHEVDFVEYKDIKTLATCYSGKEISEEDLLEKCGQNAMLFNKIKINESKPDGRVTADDGDRLLWYFLIKASDDKLGEYLITDF